LKRKQKNHKCAAKACAVAAVLALAATPVARAATKFWDLNGATTGAGGATPAGTCNTTTSNWSIASAGNVAGTTWASGDSAIFSAGTDATGAYTVTVSGTQSVGGIVVQEGKITFSGGTLSLNATGGLIDIASGLTTTINSDIGGSVGLTKSGGGTLLSGSNIYTGTTVDVNGTVLNARSVSGGGASGGNILLSGGHMHVVQASTTTYAGSISGGGIPTKEGSGTLVLSGSNSHTHTNIEGGALSVSSDASLGSTGANVSLREGTLKVTDTFSASRPMSLNGPGGTIEVAAGHALTLTGVIRTAILIGGGVNGTLTKTGSAR
jgi:autotransporter-associated beta strand protein